MSKELFTIYWFFSGVHVRYKINGLFYNIRKLPLIGKKISPSFYQAYELKDVLFYFGVAFSVLKKVLFKFLWLGIFRGIASFLPQVTEGMGYLWFFLWLFFVLLMIGFFSGLYQLLPAKAVQFVENFQVSGSLFAKSLHVVEVIYDGICYAPALLVFSLVGGLPWYTMIIGVSLYIGLATAFRYMGRLLQDISKPLRFSFFTIGEALFSFIGVTIFLNGKIEVVLDYLLNPISLIVILLLTVFVLHLLLNYKRENEYLLKLFAKSSLQASEVKKAVNISKDSLAEGTNMQKKINLTDTSSLEHLKGQQYLNALLFKRYEKTLFKEARIKVIGILGLGVVFSVGSLLLGGMPINEADMVSFLPSLFFIMYLLSFGKKIVQMCYLNCDSVMLTYPFYREADSVVKGFLSRFWRTFQYNSLLVGAIFVVAILFHVSNDFFLSVNFFLMLFLLLLSLSLLFSFHELFVYYLLQPFSVDKVIVNPVYKLVSSVFYAFAYVNFILDINSRSYLFVIAIVGILYVLIGMQVIKKVGPRTFRIKY